MLMYVYYRCYGIPHVDWSYLIAGCPNNIKGIEKKGVFKLFGVFGEKKKQGSRGPQAPCWVKRQLPVRGSRGQSPHKLLDFREILDKKANILMTFLKINIKYR